jgi:hypothetical protein
LLTGEGDLNEARGLNILTCIKITVEVDYRQAFECRSNPYGEGQNAYFTLKQATKAQTGSGGMATLFL